MAAGGDDAGALVVVDLVGQDSRGVGAELGPALEVEDVSVPIRRPLIGLVPHRLALLWERRRRSLGQQDENEAERCHRGAKGAPTGSGRELQRDLVAVLSRLIP